MLCLIRTGNIKLIRPVGSTPRYKGKSIPKFGLPSDLDPPPEIIVKEKETPAARVDPKPKSKSTKNKKPMNTVQKSFSRNSRDHSEMKEVGPSRNRAESSSAMKSLSTTRQTVTYDGYSIKSRLDKDKAEIIEEAVRLMNDLKSYSFLAINAFLDRPWSTTSSISR
jgi:outer membrane biosynthesis protein TonB